MDPGRRWHRLAARLALVAWLLAAVVPAAGLVICFQQNGTTKVGMGTACPCGLDHQGAHPPCSDVQIDGLRDVAPTPPPLPEHAPVAWLSLALEQPGPVTCVPEPEPRAGPWTIEDPPGRRLALTARRSVVLLI